MSAINSEFTRLSLRKEFTPRIYQQMIFFKCLRKDVLIVLPTGLGKTLIAAMLAIFKLNKNPNSKIIFLAPTKPLVIQHKESFINYMTIEPEQLNILTGAISPKKRKEIWESSLICFMTPQTLRNDLINNLYELKNVSLIIFDEAHRAVGDYAYTEIARMYHDSAEQPHILAMTASPGGTIEKIDEVKNNLFIEEIIVRDENDPDVKPYIQKKLFEYIEVELPEEFIQLKTILYNEFDKIRQFIKNKNLIQVNEFENINRRELIKINKIALEKVKDPKYYDERNDLFNLIKIIAVGMRLSHAIELIETQGVQALEKYIDQCIKNSIKPDCPANLRYFVNLIKSKNVESLTKSISKRGIIHPKLNTLLDILKKHLKSNSKSRILIFANYRLTTSLVVNFLKDKGFSRISRFVGQQSSKKEKGMSQKQQEEILKKFNSGEIQILVSTSVAEEGLDIEDCDLVIFYDMIPSEIRAIQRRGRTGRKKAGKVIFLMAKGTIDEAYYYSVLTKEKRMKDTLKSLKKGNIKKVNLDSFNQT
ncbi:MAG: helicase-related protein [Promethearchaeota archaeon]